MVLDASASFIFSKIPSSQYVIYGLGAAAIVATRKWSAGYTSKEERDLHNKTFILIGAFSGAGLSLFHSLAIRGAQIIALHPNPSAENVVQILYLLRATSENERIYVDECDMTDIGSIREFVQVWEKDGRMGMVGDLEARIDCVVFCDGEGAGLESSGIGKGKQVSSSGSELYHSTLSLHRYAFIQLLLPTLVKSAVVTPVRIIYNISPFYSTGEMRLDDLDYTLRKYPTWNPWRVEGSATLASIALMRELHERVVTKKIMVIGVCGGFNRSYWRQILRASPSHLNFSYLGFLAFVLLLPFLFLFTKSAEESVQGLISVALGSLGGEKKLIMVGEEAILEDDEDRIRRELKSKPLANGEERDERIPKKFRGGMIYREGIEMRIRQLESFPTLGPDLWKVENNSVDRLVQSAIKLEASKGKGKGSQGSKSSSHIR